MMKVKFLGRLNLGNPTCVEYRVGFLVSHYFMPITLFFYLFFMLIELDEINKFKMFLSLIIYVN